MSQTFPAKNNQPAKPVKKSTKPNYGSMVGFTDRGGIAKPKSKKTDAKLKVWLDTHTQPMSPPMGADGQYLNAISSEDKVYAANVSKLCGMVAAAQQKVNALRTAMQNQIRDRARPTVNLTTTRTYTTPGNVAAKPNEKPGGGSGAGADGSTYMNVTGLEHDLAVAENQLREAVANCNKAQDAKRRWDAENSAGPDAERAKAERDRQNAQAADTEKKRLAELATANSKVPAATPTVNTTVVTQTQPSAPVDMGGMAGGFGGGGGGGMAPEEPIAETPTEEKPKGRIMPMIIMAAAIGGILWYVNSRGSK